MLPSLFIDGLWLWGKRREPSAMNDCTLKRRERRGTTWNKNRAEWPPRTSGSQFPFDQLFYTSERERVGQRYMSKGKSRPRKRDKRSHCYESKHREGPSFLPYPYQPRQQHQWPCQPIGESRARSIIMGHNQHIWEERSISLQWVFLMTCNLP